MFLPHLKENIKINSKPFAALRNEVVKYLLSLEDSKITSEAIKAVVENSSAYSAAKYDIQTRFLSFSAGHSLDSALLLLLSNNPDLVFELHALMGETVDPKVSAIAYQRILAQDKIAAITVSDMPKNSKDSFYEAQEFLSRHGNLTALAVHFKCTKRLGSIIDILNYSQQKDATLLTYLAIPFVNLFDLAVESNVSDVVMANMILHLFSKLPDLYLSPENVLQIESLLDQMDKKLLAHISKVFSGEKDGTSVLFQSITTYFFVDKYVVDISQYIFDLFVISSSEFSTGDSRLPKIETWRIWICTCILLEFSANLLELSGPNQILSYLESSLIPSLKLSRLKYRLKNHFVKPFKDFYSVKGENLISLIKPKWIWDENVIPLTEDLLIDRESGSRFKAMLEKEHFNVDPVESSHKSISNIKPEKESGMVDTLFRKSKKKDRHVSISQNEDTSQSQNSNDPAKEVSKKGPENVAEPKTGQAVDVAENGETIAEDRNLFAKAQSFVRKKIVQEPKESYSCDIESVILESARNIQKVFGFSDSGASRYSDIETIASLLNNSGQESFNAKILSVQISLFQKEMTTSDIMQLPIADRELYFQKLQMLKSDSSSTSTRKRSQKIDPEKLYHQSIEEILITSLKRIGADNGDFKAINSAEDAAQAWKKAEIAVQSKIWGRELNREDLQNYLKPDMKDGSVDSEKRRQLNRDEYLRRMSTKLSKLV